MSLNWMSMDEALRRASRRLRRKVKKTELVLEGYQGNLKVRVAPGSKRPHGHTSHVRYEVEGGSLYAWLEVRSQVPGSLGPYQTPTRRAPA